MTAGADAHSNKGYYLIADDEGNRHLGVKIDPYETVFRLVRMHILLETGTPLTRESIIEALRKGHAFVGFDVLGDTSGFGFTAGQSQAGRLRSDERVMGDEIELGGSVRLSAVSPMPARFVLLRDGEKISEFADASEIAANVTEPGTYRVEVYLDKLGPPFDAAPWIMSNPIYVR